MGMYTRFHFAAPIVQENAKLLDWLQNLCDINGSQLSPKAFDNHEFFATDKWQRVFWGSSGVGDIARPPSFTRPPPTQTYGDPELVLNSLVLKSSVKNAGDEIDLFIKWISQYVEESQGYFLGYSVYEESRDTGIISSTIEVPTFYYLGVEPIKGRVISLEQSDDPPF